jgi:UDP-N-acetylmuramyl pentapeptide synthase
LVGMHGKIHTEGSIVPFRISGAFGKRHIYAALASVAVAAHFSSGPPSSSGINIVEAIEAMKEYAPPAGSGRFMRGIKHTGLLDVSMQATPFLVRETIEIIEALHEGWETGRTLVALGDIHVEGESMEDIYISLGEFIGRVADTAYLVGSNARYTADGLSALLGEEHVRIHDSSQECGSIIQQDLRKEDRVFIFGSGESGMEKVVEELRADIS